jgi:hypothetical protein
VVTMKNTVLLDVVVMSLRYFTDVSEESTASTLLA